jgi:TolA-binding protein
MRIQLLAILLLAGTAMPAGAQERIDRRLSKLEQEMQAVQRRVFPNGPLVQPEISPGTGLPAPIGSPAGSALADLTARVDALEAQLADLTGQAEQNAFRLRQLEEALAAFRSDAGARLETIEKNATQLDNSAAPETDAALDAAGQSVEEAASAVEQAAGSGDPAEDAYIAGFRFWDAGNYQAAIDLLAPIAAKYPDHRRASWAANLAGRAQLDAGNPAAAARTLLANYQRDPKGERAADSLFFLGEALVKLERLAEACKVYDELEDVYGASMRDFLRQRLPAAREAANCT